MAGEILVNGVRVTPRGNMDKVQLMSLLHGKHYQAVKEGRVFVAHAIVTAPVIYTTASGTGGPLIWNGSADREVNVLKIGWGQTVVTTVAAALGWTGATGQQVAPTSTTAIDSRANLLLGGEASKATPYRVGTPLNAGTFLMPFSDVNTGALTTTPGRMNWIDVDGLCIIPPQCWGSIAASATATTLVIQTCVVYEEIQL